MNTEFFTWQNVLIIGLTGVIAVYLMDKFENKEQKAI